MADAVIWLNKNSLSVYRTQFENGVCIPNQLPENCATYGRNMEEIDRKKKALIAVGRFDDNRKGLGDLLRAFEIIHSKHKDAELYIIGSYDLQLPLDSVSKITCQSFIKKCRFDETCLHFAGWVENIADYYTIGMLHIMPSYYEGFGLVVLEAAANGVPTAAYDGSGMADIISDETNGIVVEAIAAQWRELVATIVAGDDKKKKLFFSNHAFQDIGDVELKRIIAEYEDTIIKIYKDLLWITQEKDGMEIYHGDGERNIWEEECLAMQKTLSWRITKPLRWLGRTLGRQLQ